MARLIAELRRRLDELLERFRSGRRSGLVLTLLAVHRLAKRGEEITPESVANEAGRIIEERPDVDWGVSGEDDAPALAASLLQELVEMGVLEPDPAVEGELRRRFRVASYHDGDPMAEVYSRFGYLLFYGGPAR